MRGEYRVEDIRIYNGQGSYGTVITNALANSPYTKSSVLVGLDYDNRDSLFLPRKGQEINFSAFVAGGALGGDVQDYGINLTAKKYFSLPWDMIFLTRGSVGVVNSWGGGASPPPIFDELYLGGANDMRGFAFREVGPKDQNGNPIGGDTSVEGTLELTYPIIPRLRGAFFTDWGYVNSGLSISPSQAGYGSGGLNGDMGIGVRLELPIGPIRIDWGYPVKSDSYNHSNGQFNFNVGYTF